MTVRRPKYTNMHREIAKLTLQLECALAQIVRLNALRDVTIPVTVGEEPLSEFPIEPGCRYEFRTGGCVPVSS